MISCLLIHVSRNAQGVPVCKDSVITGSTLQIGRGAGCKIHLLDHRVSLLHATITRSENGLLYIEADKNTTLKINGFIAQREPLQPGTQVEIGPYSLVVEPSAGGHDLILSLELIHLLTTSDTVTYDTPVTLNELGLSKRKLGLNLAAGILFLFMILPMLPSASVVLDKWQASLPVTLTGAWSPGPLAGGHIQYEAKCTTCHQQPFQPVADKVCTACHKQVGHHMSNEGLQLKSFKNMPCTECHTDHKGSEKLILHDSSRCVSCHGDIKRKSASTPITNVHDFATDHPPFHITLRDEKGATRVLQSDKNKLFENPGLKYSHKIHLVKTGVSSPQGDTVMKCQDCHIIRESGRHFEPMTMKKTCQQSECHSLDFTEPVEGYAPHGSERAVMNHLRLFYAKWLNDSADNRSACDLLVQGITACADKLARQNAASTLFRKNKECGECHEIVQGDDDEVPWKITPVRINRDWQPGASFVHSKHNAMQCTDCHDKMNSTVSADISMPTIEKCRECHVGNHPARGKITSGCDSCHKFHQGTE